MQCCNCSASNDADAVYCIQCGKLTGEEEKTTRRQRKIILGVLLLLIVMGIAAAAGYYKFILPDGVAAVVNGEVIRLSELNAEVSRIDGALREDGTARTEGDAAGSGGRRYQVLNRMITDRLALQEARKAGLEVSAGRAFRGACSSRPQYEKKRFNELVSAQDGSLQAFEQRLSQDLLINKFITKRVVPAGADPGTARAAVDRWLQDLSRTAAVRIALAEQWSAAGCSCCNGGAANQAGRQATAVASPNGSRSAADAALGYWRERHGGGPYTTRVTDLGCHMQIDIMQGNTVVGSLRYQDGVISKPHIN
jgi:predicted nucleic acid-binding Zn ribbon protein